LEREALRAKTTDLMQRLRAEQSVSQALWDLLDTLQARLDRIELGAGFVAPDEVPTKPDRKASSPFQKALEILEKK
jgi:hypothetical protein